MTRHVLMCEPIHYRIAYEINPWMRRKNAVDNSRARAQWRALYDALVALGVRVDLVDQGEDVPDMTFTANAGLATGTRFIPANFRHVERMPERPRFVEWFERAGYRIEPVSELFAWEGEGDVLSDDAGTLFCGFPFRTDFAALDRVDDLLGAHTVRIELVHPHFYHLDTCFAPLGKGRALWYPEALSEVARRTLQRHLDQLIEVPRDEAMRFACNVVAVDGTILMNEGCPRTAGELRSRGFDTIEVPTDEFIKAGGSVKCLVLTLDSLDWADRGATNPLPSTPGQSRGASYSP